MFYYCFLFFIAYTGQFCDLNFDACLETSCFEGVTCSDNPAPETGATCGPCPPGLEGDGSKCIGESMHIRNHLCYQECIRGRSVQQRFIKHKFCRALRAAHY